MSYRSSQQNCLWINLINPCRRYTLNSRPTCCSSSVAPTLHRLCQTIKTTSVGSCLESRNSLNSRSAWCSTNGSRFNSAALVNSRTTGAKFDYMKVVWFDFSCVMFRKRLLSLFRSLHRSYVCCTLLIYHSEDLFQEPVVTRSAATRRSCAGQAQDLTRLSLSFEVAAPYADACIVREHNALYDALYLNRYYVAQLPITMQHLSACVALYASREGSLSLAVDCCPLCRLFAPWRRFVNRSLFPHCIDVVSTSEV